MFRTRAAHANVGRRGLCPRRVQKREGGIRHAEGSPKPRPDPKRLCDLARMADEPQSTDVLGSYTGTAQDGGRPVQDADDL